VIITEQPSATLAQGADLLGQVFADDDLDRQYRATVAFSGYKAAAR